MKKIIATVYLACIILTSVSAQTVLLEEDLKSDTIQTKWGPNLSHFGHFYLDFGFFIGPSDADSARISEGYSNTFSIGYRYKKRICNFYAVGFDIHFTEFTYRLKQYGEKIIPNPI